jgi:hypothetical protein
MKVRINSIREIFTNPNRIINYSLEKWSLGKFIILSLISGYIYGINFFYSNFNINLTLNNIGLVSMIFLAGILLLYFLISPYLVLSYLFSKIFLKIDKKNREEISQPEEVITLKYINKRNLKNWVQLYSYCFLIPFFLYNLIIFLVNLLLLSLELTYVVSYLWVYSRILLYFWIISLTLYSATKLDDRYKFRINLIQLISFGISYLSISLLLLYLEQYMKGFFL